MPDPNANWWQFSIDAEERSSKIRDGAGGVPYLGHARKDLIPLFPALIAYLDLEDSPTFSWVE